jgi:chromate reductase, NAD(P)H dehydrogenase (quinone)
LQNRQNLFTLRMYRVTKKLKIIFINYREMWKMKTHHIVAVAGSINTDSLNKALVKTMITNTPDDVSIDEIDINNLPFYNRSLEENDLPASIKIFKSALDKADGVIICTPEYDHSVPGVLKNALDWAGREASKVVLSKKPVAVAGATTGSWGTVRAQQALRHILFAQGANVMSSHVLMVPKARSMYIGGELKDVELQRRIKKFIEGFVAFIDE